MFFAITALGVSAVQIAIGVAIGLSLRKTRQRQRIAAQTPSASDGQHEVAERSSAPNDVQAPLQTDAPLADAIEAAATAVSTAKQTGESGKLTNNEPYPAKVKARGEKAAYSVAPAPVAAEPDVLPSGGNRRNAARRSFEFMQQVAPYHGGMLPGKASFREVECVDISATGFSFLSSQLPDFDSVVVALGVAPRQVHVWAQIVNRFQVDDGAAPLYRIGCRFVGPVNP